MPSQKFQYLLIPSALPSSNPQAVTKLQPMSPRQLRSKSHRSGSRAPNSSPTQQVSGADVLMKNQSLRHMVYELKGGYLLLPGFITVGLSIIAILLPELEICDP